MGTKSKKHNGVAVAALALCVLAAVVAASIPLFAGAVQESPNSWLVEDIYHNGFVLFWELMQEKHDTPMSPGEVFLPPEYQDKIRENGELYGGESYQELLEQCNDNLTLWQERFHSNWNQLRYTAVLWDDTIIGNGNDVMQRLALDFLQDEVVYDDEEEEAQRLREKEVEFQAAIREGFSYLAVLRYDRNGDIWVERIYGADEGSLSAIERRDMWYHWDQVFSSNGSVYRQMDLPRSMVVVYGVPIDVEGGYIQMQQRSHDRWAFMASGFDKAFLAAAFLTLLFALVYSRIWKQRAGWVSKIPLELAVILMGTALTPMDILTDLGIQVGQSSVTILSPILVVTGQAVTPAICLMGFAVLLFYLILLFIPALSVTQVFDLGLLRYLKTRSLVIGFFVWVYRNITNVDLEVPGNKPIVKILVVNFILAALCCCLWFFGIFGLLIYSLVAFFLLQRWLLDLHGKYRELLRVTGEMARGKLDTPIQGDMGPFSALGRELDQVQSGFRRAVHSEVRSQHMRTELISNVSHDLKTPLTAIITYVDLLKDDTITEEQRQSYIETLDNKSQRLKRLIEDLFEVSKANTGNLPMEAAPVDLVELIRQVEWENKEAIEAAGLDFRSRIPDHPVIVTLDGDKTSRVFDNLIINATKYAFPGSRAYIDIVVEGGWVTTEIKNISREPLDFDTSDLTERFTRGDRSRNTEGSGLGLAIVKSFVELQGGQFRIVTDGDLFKAVVRFRLDPPAQEPTPEE